MQKLYFGNDVVQLGRGDETLVTFFLFGTIIPTLLVGSALRLEAEDFFSFQWEGLSPNPGESKRGNGLNAGPTSYESAALPSRLKPS